ncbi:MAG TPA: hypothetical protein PKK26_17785 [Candidatus Wallbacteria bacterium]|nr:hypothetical protein [Candidatus Wallbacteria bacterium]
MADEEKKPSSSIIKFLLIGIAFLAAMVLSAVVSISTYKMLMESKDVEEVADKVAVDSIDLDEIVAYTVKDNEKGIIKFKINAEVNDVKVKEYLATKKPAIKDTITRAIMLFYVKDAMQSYQDGRLHKAIADDLNKIVGENNIKVEKPMLGGGKKKKFMVVNVNIFDFSAMVLD